MSSKYKMSPSYYHIVPLCLASSNYLDDLAVVVILTDVGTVILYARCVLSVSIFFWAWALKNTIGMQASNFDLGVVSFGTTALTSTYLLGVTSSSGGGPFTSRTRVCLAASQGFVALNYALGSYLGFAMLGRPAFGIYCAIFVLIWIGVAVVGARLLKVGASSPQTESQNLV